MIQLLEEEQIDIIVLAGFLKILSRDFVRRYPTGFSTCIRP